jgi:sugar O-acyltransferase (sialic acid O-acetyltransferase NeuD family)
MQPIVMVVADRGSTPRISLDVAGCLGTPIVGLVRIGGTGAPFECDLPLLGGDALLADRGFLAEHGIANGVQGRARPDIGRRVMDAGGDLRTLIHPRATIAGSAVIEAGCLISAGAIVNVDARIGRHCLIHSGATIDHDDVLEDGVVISPGVHLAGHVTVGAGTFVGIGATAVGGITIGRGATVGAGAVVIRDVPDHSTVVGNPARPLPPRSDRPR